MMHVCQDHADALEPNLTPAGAWHPDLRVLNYGDPLPAPCPAVQATLTGFSDPAIHEYSISTDKQAVLEVDDEGPA